MLKTSARLLSSLCLLACAASASADGLKLHSPYMGIGIGVTDSKSVHPKDSSDRRSTPSILLGTYFGSDTDLAIETEYRKLGVMADDHFYANHLSASLILHNLATFKIASTTAALFFQPSLTYTKSTVDFAPFVPKSSQSGWQTSYTLGLQAKLSPTYTSSPYSLRTSYTLVPQRNSLPTNQILSLHVLRTFN